ncbi:hypothetical protein BVRB_9g206720 [Beta vulgaris subsp. vulgaris]|nr:hypothetical protein BVRB_9g206720 [Beta vulgaris subsp. vulgaris]
MRRLNRHHRQMRGSKEHIKQIFRKHRVSKSNFTRVI